MILKIAMGLILMWPLYLSLKTCESVWKGNPSNFLAGTLLKFLPLKVADVVVLIFPLIIIALLVLIILMKPL